MTDPWSVHGIDEVKTQENLSNEIQDNNIQYKVVAGQREEFQTFGFEDSFIEDNNSNTLPVGSGKNIEIITNKGVFESEHQRLPDSQTYLQSLERKLKKLKNNSKLVDALAEKREDCLRSMVQNNCTISCNNEQLLELETSITNSDSAVQNLYRQIYPVQPVTVGETVHIVKHDQLEEERLEAEVEDNNEESEKNLSASH